MGLVPQFVEDTASTLLGTGSQVVSTVVDVGQQAANDVAGAFSNLAEGIRQTAADSYDKVAALLAGLGITIEEYADMLSHLTPEQFSKYMDFINAIDSLKSLRTEILALQSHFDGIKIKDFVSGENKAYAVAMAEKTAGFLNLFNQIVEILSALTGPALFGDSLKNVLRDNNIPLLKQALNL